MPYIPWTAKFLDMAACMEDNIEWILKDEVLKDFQVHVVPSFHSLPLYPLFQLYIGSQVWNPILSPLPLSPHLSTAYGTRYLLAPNVLYLPLLLLQAAIRR